MPLKPVTNFSFHHDGETGNSSSSDILLPTTVSDSPSVDEPNLLPVYGAKVIKSDELNSGSTDIDNVLKENAGDDDDVIKTCAAENCDARVREVRVIKGELGLGFCIEGGKDSTAGDRPISVKRLFRGIVAVSGLFRNK